MGASHDGRQRDGLGGNLRRRDGTGHMAIPGERGSVQCAGIESSIPSHESILRQDTREGRAPQNGQHNGSSLCKTSRRHWKQDPAQGSGTVTGMGTREPESPLGSVCPRPGQPTGGFSIKNPVRQQRMGAASGGVPITDGMGFYASSGPIRLRQKQQSGQVCLEKSMPTGGGGRCTDGPMGLYSGICLSTNTTGGAVPQKAADGESAGAGSHTLVAETPLVPNITATKDKRPTAIAKTRRPPDTRSDMPPRAGQVTPSGLDLERGRMARAGCSQAVVNTLMQSRKESTNVSYNRVWTRFEEFATLHNFRPERAQVTDLLNFLQKGLEMGLSLSTLKGHVSAISAFSGEQWAANHLIMKFFKAVIRIKPPRPLLFPKWDLPLVLNFLNQEEAVIVEDSPLWNLTLKTTFLVAVTSASRVSELAALGAREPFTVFYEDKAVLVPVKGFLPKVTTNFHLKREIVLPTMKTGEAGGVDHLDVCRTLRAYIEATAAIRHSERLFISPDGPNRGNEASSRTIATWLTKVIGAAYKTKGLQAPKGITAHSTRGMATSWAAKRGSSPEDICRAASWSSPHTFITHYCVEPAALEATNFGLAVLSAAKEK